MPISAKPSLSKFKIMGTLLKNGLLIDVVEAFYKNSGLITVTTSKKAPVFQGGLWDTTMDTI